MYGIVYFVLIYCVYFTAIAHICAAVVTLVFVIHCTVEYTVRRFKLYADFGRFLIARAKARRRSEVLAAPVESSDSTIASLGEEEERGGGRKGGGGVGC
jgi:hypothetical protein